MMGQYPQDLAEASPRGLAQQVRRSWNILVENGPARRVERSVEAARDAARPAATSAQDGRGTTAGASTGGDDRGGPGFCNSPASFAGKTPARPGACRPQVVAGTRVGARPPRHSPEFCTKQCVNIAREHNAEALGDKTRTRQASTRGGGRTHNLRLRRPTLYPIELPGQERGGRRGGGPTAADP